MTIYEIIWCFVNRPPDVELDKSCALNLSKFNQDAWKNAWRTIGATICNTPRQERKCIKMLCHEALKFKRETPLTFQRKTSYRPPKYVQQRFKRRLKKTIG